MYDWIDTNALPDTIRLPDSAPLVLWGAGEGSRQTLAWLAAHDRHPAILGIVDNNPTRQGESFCGHPVVGPEELARLHGLHSHLLVLVTTVSGREPVAAQLDAMGLRQGHDYLLAGTYPVSALARLRTVLAAHAAHGVLHGPDGRPARVLHVGPGGFLGLEAALAALGCKVVSVDAFGFSAAYPDVGRHGPDYADVGRHLPDLAARHGFDAQTVRRRYAELFTHGATRLREGCIDYRFPHRFGDLPLEDASVDLVCSFAVLEHVRRPAQAARECARVLVPGGHSLHNIYTRDHRSLNRDAALSPIDFLRYAREEWEEIIRDTFPQNRVLPAHWREEFARTGLQEQDYRCLQFHRVDARERSRLQPQYRRLPAEVLGEIECELLCRKPGPSLP